MVIKNLSFSAVAVCLCALCTSACSSDGTGSNSNSATSEQQVSSVKAGEAGKALGVTTWQTDAASSTVKGLDAETPIGNGEYLEQVCLWGSQQSDERDEPDAFLPSHRLLAGAHHNRYPRGNGCQQFEHVLAAVPTDQYQNRRKPNIMKLLQCVNQTRSFRLSAPIVSLVLLSALFIGCTTGATSKPVNTPGEQRAYIAKSCAALKERNQRAVPLGIFLEVADLTEPIAAPVKDWLAVHSVSTHHLAGLVVPMTANTPVRGPYGICLERTCVKHEDGTLDVVGLSLPADGSAAVELQLDFTFANGRPRRLSVKTTDQEPILASLTTRPEQTLVITPYYLFEPRHQSLKLLAQCMSRVPTATGSN